MKSLTLKTWVREADIILTARSGRHALKHHLERLAITISTLTLMMFMNVSWC